MDQIVSFRPSDGLSKIAKTAGLILAGTFIAGLTIAWATFLMWLAAEAVITVVHWLGVSSHAT